MQFDLYTSSWLTFLDNSPVAVVKLPNLSIWQICKWVFYPPGKFASVFTHLASWSRSKPPQIMSFQSNYDLQNHYLGGGFKDFLFSSLLGEDSHFD